MKYDLTEVDKLFKKLSYEKYQDYTYLISYMKVSSYNIREYKVTTDINANLLDKELRIHTYYHKDGGVPITVRTEIEPELYKAIDLLLKTVGII